MEKKRIISHIVAASENNVIGREGGLPWRLPDDFRFFKDTTWAMPVIMGRRTFESMKKDLPGRINIIITSGEDYHPKDTFVEHNLQDAILRAEDADTTEIFIIGGGNVFRDSINMVQKIYLTRVHTHIDGDTLYPEIDQSAFDKTSEKYHPADRKHPFAFTFEVWERK